MRADSGSLASVVRDDRRLPVELADRVGRNAD